MQEFRKRYTGRAEQLPGLPEWESELLRARGVDTPEKAERFLRPDLGDLHEPMQMRQMDAAVELIRSAVQRGDRILVYGDYDVDGICAVTVMMETLREAGADVSFRIPARHSEGYGLNMKAVEEIAETYQLLITVDCGISNVREVARARELGVSVIVTDHHEPPEILPDANAVLNPLLGDYPFRRLCGAGVALKVCQALRGMDSVEKKLEIAALATVADVVPLTDENRIIVREGMRRMADTARPGLRALIGNAKTVLPPRADDIAFRLAPRLNAAGRLEDACQGVRLLMTEDPAEAKAIADHLEENNRLRQKTEQQILKEAMELFRTQTDLRRDRIIILEGEGWNKGLIGLVAGKICEKFYHPTVVLSRQGDQAVGSCRSIPGVNIWQMLNACGDLFLRFGGHEQAAGLTVAAEKIPEMRARLNRTIAERCPDSCFLPVREYDTELPLAAVTLEMAEALEVLEPTGCGNPPPVFLCRDADVQEARRVGQDRSHLKLTLMQGAEIRGGIGFGLGDIADLKLRRADALFCPGRNEFGGRVTVQLQVQAMRPAESAEEEEACGTREGFFLRCLQEMSLLSAKQNEHIPELTGLRPEYLLKERLAGLDASRETMGKIYLALRAFRGDSLEALQAETGFSADQLLFALTAFSQMELIRWQPDPFRAEMLPAKRKMDLEQSPAVRAVRNLSAAG